MKYEANAGPPKGDHPIDRAINELPLPQYPIAPPVAADAEPLEVMRANFEDWYMTHTSDIKAAPLGSRDSMLQWSSWIAARSGNYVARGGWQISPMPWGPAGAPVAAGSVDTGRLEILLTAFRNAETWEDRGAAKESIVANLSAWGAQQREAGWVAGRINGAKVFDKTESAVLAAAERLLRDTVIRAEKAEARVKELERALSNGTAKPSLLNSDSFVGSNEQT